MTAFKHIAIMGLGLMGGSLAKAIKAYAPTSISAITRNKTAAKQALADHSIDAHTTLENLDPSVDLVFICTPMSTLIQTIHKTCAHCSSNTLITDIGSVKGYLAAKNFPPNVVLGHPIAGSEKQGYAHAQANLFQNKRYVLIPPTTPHPHYDTLKQLITDIGSTLIECDADTHDKQLALSSHFPYFAAKAAFTLSQKAGLDPRFIGPGFQSFTRIAHSDEDWARDIATYNKTEVLKTLKDYQSTLSSLFTDIEKTP
ncbi:MAG: prephenate dehydrogenase [bacterium]